ncbi:MAG: hypothetical protein K2X50_08870 [Gammaproteobacteria bacterium]|nr:hypothetical protein [Gammaproteobacteria bacterium]
MKKVILIGTWHRDQNQTKILRQLLPFLDAEKWMVGCEYDSQYTLDQDVASAKADLLKYEDNLSKFLNKTSKVTLIDFMNMTEEQLRQRDRAFFDKINTPIEAQIKKKVLMSLTLCKSRRRHLEMSDLIKESKCIAVGIDSSELMNQDGMLRDEIRIEMDKTKKADLERRSEELERTRNNKIVDNIITASEKHEKNLIIFIGAGHVSSLKILFPSRDAIQPSFFYIMPEFPNTPLGVDEESKAIMDVEFAIFKQFEIEGITSENVGLLIDEIRQVELSKTNGM